ncbi:MAG: hypothetical protein COA79_00715 [Planctomycetota bacterium]|nr:MAG: hypothetical protein COA79_00715 [Planctomycetota bacterium]
MDKYKILIAEDTANIRKIITRLLSSTPYEIIEAVNGAEALEKIYSEMPSLILLDIMMPMKNGIEVCIEIKKNEKTKHIPVIFITAKSEPADIVKGFKAGGIDYISKPFSKIELLARINSQMDKLIAENEKEKILKEYYVSIHKKILGEISMGISHNFNNHLTSVLLNFGLLQNSLVNQEDKDRTKQIESWLVDISGMIKQFRYFTDSCERNYYPINVEEYISEKINFLVKTNFADLKIDLINETNSDIVLNLHESSFTQSIYQLLMNANEFHSKDNKNVKIVLSYSKLPENVIKREIIGDQKEYLKIAFIDDGDKFNEEYFDAYEVFTPYYSTKKTVGVGMGLSIVKNFAESHHGFTNAFNNIDEDGSTVELYIPLT